MIVLPDKFRKYLPFAGLAFLILIALTPGIYFYNKYRQTQKILSASSDLPSNELEKIFGGQGGGFVLGQFDEIAPFTENLFGFFGREIR